jgi:putative transposase
MTAYQLHDDVGLYYLTFSVVHWLPVFVAEDPCTIITESLNLCHRERSLRINAFVIMPTHLHFIVFDAEFKVSRLRRTIAAFRSCTGHRLADYVDEHLPSPYAQILRATRRADRDRQFWQQSRHAEALYTYAFWKQKSDYLHDNPRRKGLVRDSTHWRFSSAAYWLCEPPGESDVLLTPIAW